MSSFTNPNYERAFFYSPARFLRKNEPELAQAFLEDLLLREKNAKLESFGIEPQLIIHYLEWDSHYFDCPSYKLIFSHWNTTASSVETLTQALFALKDELANRHGKYYLLCEIPSEDLVMLQAMGITGFKLIETRLTYFHDDLQNFDWPQRYPVRLATRADIPSLRQVASQSRNPFDRCHADLFFGNAVADEYVATLIENSVKGFADIVLVPENNTLTPGAFLTAHTKPAVSYLAGKSMARLGVTAVSKEYRGWFIQLMIEMFFLFKSQGISLAYTNTQTTNYAIIRSLEKLHWQYGYSTHIFSTSHHGRS